LEFDRIEQRVTLMQGKSEQKAERKIKDGNQQKQSAFSIQPAQRFGTVSTGIFPSQVAESKEARSRESEGEPKTENLPPCRISKDLVESPKDTEQKENGIPEGGTSRKHVPQKPYPMKL
jgi:hypothetical protein